MRILITGAAGFIGFHLSKKLIERGDYVCGLDNFNNYYDVNLKKSRIDEIIRYSKDRNNRFELYECDIQDSLKINQIFQKFRPERVVNLAAQAGVRYSLENPAAYIHSNLVGFGNILNSCKEAKVEHLIYASSSSVYGGNTKYPFSESDNVDHPVSLYAATKKSNELMAHTYSHLFNLPTTGLRFFTVYGPWGRPDMALFLFTKAIINNEPINVFNKGDMVRDFTYVDDIVNSLQKIVDKIPTSSKEFDTSKPDPSISWAPYKIFNIGNSEPTPLMNYINCLEESLGKTAKKIFLPMQQGDVKVTSSDCSSLENWINYKPSTSIKDGISKFVKWYKDYYKIN